MTKAQAALATLAARLCAEVGRARDDMQSEPGCAEYHRHRSIGIAQALEHVLLVARTTEGPAFVRRLQRWDGPDSCTASSRAHAFFADEKATP